MVSEDSAFKKKLSASQGHLKGMKAPLGCPSHHREPPAQGKGTVSVTQVLQGLRGHTAMVQGGRANIEASRRP